MPSVLSTALTVAMSVNNSCDVMKKSKKSLEFITITGITDHI